MNIKSNEISQHDKEKIFGVKGASGFSTDGLEVRYKVEHGQEGQPDYLRQQVLRDTDGNYFMDVKNGSNGAMLSLETVYQFNEPEVLFPIRPEALVCWAEINLYGEDRMRAQEEFKIPEHTNFETVCQVDACNVSNQANFVCRNQYKPRQCHIVNIYGGWTQCRDVCGRRKRNLLGSTQVQHTTDQTGV